MSLNPDAYNLLRHEKGKITIILNFSSFNNIKRLQNAEYGMRNGLRKRIPFADSVNEDKTQILFADSANEDKTRIPLADSANEERGIA